MEERKKPHDEADLHALTVHFKLDRCAVVTKVNAIDIGSSPTNKAAEVIPAINIIDPLCQFNQP